jgi:hypothetical protein
MEINLFSFLSRHPIDKIVQGVTSKTIVNDGATTNAPQKAKIVTSTEVNPYGKRCFVRARWSIDGGINWNSLLTHLKFSFDIEATDPDPNVWLRGLNGLKAAVSVGTDTNSVYFRTANGFHDDYVILAGGVYAYTPTSLTFIIQYILFEIE